jgi:3-methyl-2-oxobutanoate hydroxymethyltransferase
MEAVVRRLTEIGIPVIGHLGLTPQSVHALGGFRPQGRDEKAAADLMADARAIEGSGAAAVVLESIPAELARQVTASLSIPTIGIGAGPDCDGQVLVSHDVFGMLDGPSPPFARQYARLGEAMIGAAGAYIADVRAGRFPPPPGGERKPS